MKEHRLSFKKESRETGLGSIGYPYQSVIIKSNGCQCGVIYAPNWQQDGWRIRFMVEKNKPSLDDGNPNCEWMWLPLGQCRSESAAREQIKIRWQRINEELTLHLQAMD